MLCMLKKICHIEMITMYRHIASGFSNFLIFRFLNIIFLQVVFSYKVRTPQKIMYPLLCLKWITNKMLLYSTGNSVQCMWQPGWEGHLAGKWIHAYV